MKPFIISISLLLWSIFSLASYQWIAGRTLPTTCNFNTTDVDTTKPWGDGCFTFQWAFISVLVVSILLLLRSIGEEILLAKMKIRPSSNSIKIGLLQERVLYQVVKYARNHGVIPGKNDPNNILPDLSLPIHSDNEGRMLSILEERVYYGSFNHNLERNGLLLVNLREQAGKIFDLIAPQTGSLREEDFTCITSSKDHRRRCFTTFNLCLESEISRKQFIAAVERIYTSRKSIWSSYLDRKRLADIMRVIFGIAFWIIAVIIVLLLADISFDTAILPLSSFVLGFSFAFSKIMVLMVESFVLMLVVRPFDVGDIIAINYLNIDRFEVVEIGLFRTLFRRTDGKFVSVPNSELINTSLLNLTRSDAYVFWIPVVLSWDGSISSVIALKEAMTKYCEDSPDLTDGGGWIERVPKSNDLLYYHCGVCPNVSWARRRDQEELKLEFVLYMQTVARRLGIRWRQPDLPIEFLHSIKDGTKYIPPVLEKTFGVRKRNINPGEGERDRFIQ